MALRRVPIRRSSNRVILFMGGDRELVMLSGLLAGALIFSAMNWFATLFGAALWFIALRLLRSMAKSDPRMRQAYMRNRRYAVYYPPRSTPFRINPESQGKQYQ
ncbi:conjugal transfer protein TrbD [Stenotrophomonas sp. C3(2023)]|uniref:conjugal transfer protein TrbD n=1 Tax=Stenotrophomonas sp. C3(2023) TaxID=3080277 RepID=UPI00293C892A|nr:conjugal transfer protein TrbD [Stenotrophomonas sp. C3(2023)]MDV3470253.1 conjugal transfer protein TrbD [Stenotrophomonas sp. C3(2023)]